GRGDAGVAPQWAVPALADAQARGYSWQILEASRALGMAALLAHRPASAVEYLRAVWEYTEEQGVEDPGAFPVAPELVEALVEAGGPGRGGGGGGRPRGLSERAAHPGGVAAASRLRAFVPPSSGQRGRPAAPAPTVPPAALP